MDAEEIKDKAEPEETKPENKAEEKSESAPEQPETTPQKAQEVPDSSELTSLKAELARARTERTAALEAVRMGVDPKHLDYVLKLAEFPENADSKAISAAIRKVIDDVPAFKSVPGNQKGIRIGADDPKEKSDSEALSKAFGNK